VEKGEEGDVGDEGEKWEDSVEGDMVTQRSCRSAQGVVSTSIALEEWLLYVSVL
jgi:hypothetical protein